MKENKKNYIIIFLIFLISMYITTLIYRNMFFEEYRYFISKISFNDKLSSLLNVLITLGTSGVLTIVTYKGLNKNINRNFVKFIYVIYFTILFFVLFLKNKGISGVNLDPLEGVYELKNGYYSEILINIIVFIPIGFLNIGKKLSRVVIIRLIIAIILVEIFQYMFFLGFFDVVDIVSNIIGFVLGHFIINLSFFRKTLKENSGKYDIGGN